ncbi:Hypothetical predicted protein [Octopus vulgaris]|uniref:Biotin-protein ligase N-terminal domain-containing protein n=1 Tax=Octopus vulgaris TaxID=6645 RepID=A0AA36BVA0_OCTVU|nr:Hypothetical predicted protein [Octopus vulgaris]
MRYNSPENWQHASHIDSLTIKQQRLYKIMSPTLNKKTVYVYNGEGCGETSLSMLMESLTSSLDTRVHDVQMISAKSIIEGSWTKDAAAICFGGGYDLGFIRSLGKLGVKTIQDYVYQGGSYLGICAGAYFACDAVAFDKGGPMEVVGERHLKFFHGSCEGPCYPGFKYNSEIGAKPALVNFVETKTTFPVYYNGGGACFQYENADPVKHPKSKILAHFEELNNKPIAVVKNEVGLGRSVLSNVHLEFNPHLLDERNEYLSQFLDALKDHEEKRKRYFVYILTHLNLSV